MNELKKNAVINPNEEEPEPVPVMNVQPQEEDVPMHCDTNENTVQENEPEEEVFDEFNVSDVLEERRLQEAQQ